MKRPKVLIKTGPGSRGLAPKIRKKALAALRSLGLNDAELSIVLTGDEGIRELNRVHRGMDRPTDVLSFPQGDPRSPLKAREDMFMHAGAGPRVLGDVVISVEKAAAQAVEYGVGLEEELSRLLVHGLLHLIGYDHVRGGTQARRMREKQEEVLKLIV